jgi:hypothetical protein
MWLPVLVWAAMAHKTPAGLWRAALPASLFNIGAQICFGLAPYYIDPGLMTFSLRVQIVFVTIGAVLLFPAERATIRSWGFLTGIAMVLGGTISVLLLKPGGLMMLDDVRNDIPKSDHVVDGLKRWLDEDKPQVEPAWSSKYMEAYRKL